MINVVRKIVLSSVLCLFYSQQINAGLILTAPPRESKKEGESLYGPLAEHLSKVLGEKVEYKYPRGWLRYQRDMKRDKFDIVFDGPHFVSWRVLHRQHKPLVKLPGTLDFYFIARKESDEIKTTKDLELKKVCVIPPPNLTSLVLLNVLNSPIREPRIVSVKGGMGAVASQLANKNCVGGVIRSAYFNKKLSDEQRSKFKIIHVSSPIPNQAITASSRVSKDFQEKILNALTREDTDESVKNVLKRFSGKKMMPFIETNIEVYKGHNELLEGVVLGW